MLFLPLASPAPPPHCHRKISQKKIVTWRCYVISYWVNVLQKSLHLAYRIAYKIEESQKEIVKD